MRKLIVLVSSVFLFSCLEKEESLEPQQNYKISVDSVLTQTGKQSLPKDSKGLYHLKLLRSPKQQPYRLTGRILLNGKEPIPAELISWESNLYWWLRRGDVVAYIVKSYVNYYTGEYTIAKLPPLIASKDYLVPTVNGSSYSGKNGEINTIIAPTGDMIGDTLIVKLSHYESDINLYTKVVLE